MCLKSVFSKIAKWYKGGPLPTRENNGNNNYTVRLPNQYEPPLIAKVLNSAARNYKFIINTLIAIAMLIVTALGVYIAYLVFIHS